MYREIENREIEGELENGEGRDNEDDFLRGLGGGGGWMEETNFSFCPRLLTHPATQQFAR